MSDWRQRFACDTCADHRPSDREIARYRCERCGRSLRFTPPAAGRVDEHRGGPWRYAAWLPCDTHAELDPGNAIGVGGSPTRVYEL